MFFKNNYLLFLFLLLMIPYLLINANMTQTNKKELVGNICQIRNEKYSNEYLYWSNELRVGRSPRNNIFTRPLANVNDSNKIRWLISETKNNTDSFYLKTTASEYLCATAYFADMFLSRRFVQRIKLDKYGKLLDDCKWNIRKVNTKLSNSTYSIVNVFYDEPLYAASFVFKRGLYNRQAFLWHKKNFDSNEYKWNINCTNAN